MKRHVVMLWVANGTFLVLTLAASFFSDMNGRLLGMGERTSVVSVCLLVALGLLLDVLALLADRARWPISLAIAVGYAGLLLPVLG